MLHVTCAIILEEDKILICQRSTSMKLPLKWEFPGGKVENGESLIESLIREIKEELDLTIEVKIELSSYTHHYKDFSLILYPFICKIAAGNIVLKEHMDYKWVNKNELLNFDLAEADLPILNQI